MSTESLSPIADELRELEASLASTRDTFEAAVVSAHEAGRSPAEIAHAARITRRRVYAILNRAGVELDSEFGRDLVRHRRNTKQKPIVLVKRIERDPATGLPIVPHEEIDVREARTTGIVEQPELFDEPADGPPEPEISILDYLHKVRRGEAE